MKSKKVKKRKKIFKWHDHLLKIVKKLSSDFEPWGMRPDEERGSDCSGGCKWFLPLDGVGPMEQYQSLGSDWGVCANKKSPRCGLLSFEHQGCTKFEYEGD